MPGPTHQTSTTTTNTTPLVTAPTDRLHFEPFARNSTSPILSVSHLVLNSSIPTPPLSTLNDHPPPLHPHLPFVPRLTLSCCFQPFILTLYIWNYYTTVCIPSRSCCHSTQTLQVVLWSFHFSVHNYAAFEPLSHFLWMTPSFCSSILVFSLLLYLASFDDTLWADFTSSLNKLSSSLLTLS